MMVPGYNGLVVSEPPSIRLCNNRSGELKAFASVVFNGAWKVDDIRIVVLPDGRHHVAMPSRVTPEGVHVDMTHPIHDEARRWFDQVVLKAYVRECRYVAMWEASVSVDPTAPPSSSCGHPSEQAAFERAAEDAA